MKWLSIGLSVALGLLLLVPSSVRAIATETPYHVTGTVLHIGNPVRIWVDDEGVRHVRGRLIMQALAGDFVGTRVANQSLNIEVSTGNGDGFGSFVETVEWQGLHGTFEGRLTIVSTGGSFVVTTEGHGTGDFEGMQNREVFSAAIGVPTFEGDGIVLNPHG